MQDPDQLATIVAWAGFALAFFFGWVAAASHFCTMGAVSDVVNIGDWSRMRMWLLAVAVAMAGTQLMIVAGWIDLSQSLYTGERVIWLSHMLGGSMFGVGMTLASGCGARNLVRLGGGNLKSLIVLCCLGASAYMTMKGVFAPLRVNYADAVHATMTGGQDLPRMISNAIDIDSGRVRIVLATLLAGLLIGFVFLDGEFRRNRQFIVAGGAIGALVAAGWYVTANLGYLAEDPNTLSEAFAGTNTRRPESFTYVGPVAYSLELLLLWTDASLRVTFGIAAVIGMFAGALAHAVTTRRFRWEGFTTVADLRSHLIGGLLMGIGGVVALGCTIGQGISGVSTLAFGSFLTLFFLILSSALTMKWMYWRMQRSEDGHP